MLILKKIVPWILGTLFAITLATTTYLVVNNYYLEKNITQQTVSQAVKSTVLIITDTINPEDRNLANATGLLGSGTGFFVKVTDDTGYIVTNHHVIANYVKLGNRLKLKIIIPGRPWDYNGTLLGSDPITDIAIVEVKKKDEETWKALAWGDSYDMALGTTVFSVGHGLNFNWSVTSGIVSAKDRINLRPLNFMLQHDSVINSGNSGGPVLNNRGEVVGVNDLLISPRIAGGQKNPGWDGVSIAIPSWQAKRSVDQILEKGHVTYPDFNFTFDFISTPAEAQRIKRYLGKRTYVKVVYDKNDADEKLQIEKMGDSALRHEDVVYEIDGKPIKSPLEVIKHIVQLNANDVITLKVLRGDEKLTVKYALGVFRQEGQSVIVIPPRNTGK